MISNLFAKDFQSIMPCMQKYPVEQFSEIIKVVNYLEFHGANNNEISNAPCKTISILSTEDMKNYIQGKISKVKTKSSTINGVIFKDEAPELISIFNLLTKSMDKDGFEKMPKRQKNFQKEFKINPECDKVLCAVSKIWGEEMGVQALYIFLKYKYNISEYAFDYSDRFTKEEMEDVIMTLEDLPKEFTPLGFENQRLTHFTRGYIPAEYSEYVAADSTIMLFDRWNSVPRFEQQYLLYHELSHNISRKLHNLDTNPKWLKLSGWIKKGEKWSHPEDACFISGYSLDLPYEDFAETVTTYRYNAKYLKETCPEKYNFIKNNVFKGKEYSEAALCSE